MIDQDKRDTLVKFSALALAPCIVLSSSVDAANSDSELNQTPTVDTNKFDQPDLLLTLQSSVKTADGRTLCRVSLCNRSSQDVELRSVYPGVIRTASGTFDINQKFQNGPLRIGGGADHYFWVTSNSSTLASKTVSYPEPNGRKVRLKIVTRSDLGDTNTGYLASTALALLA